MLVIQFTVKMERRWSREPFAADSSILDVCIERLQEEFNQLDCTDQRRDRMDTFFKAKRPVGELEQDDLINIRE